MSFNLTFQFCNVEFCQTAKKKKLTPITLLLELFAISELEKQVLGIIVYGNTMFFLWQ